MSIIGSFTTDKYTRPVGSLAGQTIKLMNFTNYDVMVLVGADQVDLIPAYQYLIMPNEPDLWLTIVTPETTNYVYPSSYIAAKTFDDVLSYEIGSLIHFMSVSPGDTVNVSGDMTITNTPNVFVNGGSMSVNITGSPTMNLATGTTVGIAGTPAVTLTGASNNVNIGNTPTVNIGGTVTVQLTASGNSVNIANVPSVAIQGTPSMNVANTSIPIANASGTTLNIAGQVNIGNTPSVSISGTPNVAIASGTVNANIQNASLNSNVLNAKLATNELILVEYGTFSTGVLAPNANTRIPDSFGNWVLGYFDYFYIFIDSTQRYGSYTIEKLASGVYVEMVQGNGSSHYIASNCNATYTTPVPSSRDTGTYICEVSLDKPAVANHVIANIYNRGSGTVTNDTITYYVYGRQASTQSNVTNTSLPANVTNALLGTGPAVKETLTLNVNALANGSYQTFGFSLPDSFYDEYVMCLLTTNYGGSQTLSQRYAIRQYMAGISANQGNWAQMPYFTWQDSTTGGGISTVNYFNLDASAQVANGVFFEIHNQSGATITETLTVTLYAKYSSYNAAPAAPVSVQSVTLNPSASGNVFIPILSLTGPPQVSSVTKFMVTVYNTYSTALPSNAYIDFTVNDKYVASMIVGGLNIGIPTSTFTIDLYPGVYPGDGLYARGYNFGSTYCAISAYAIL